MSFRVARDTLRNPISRNQGNKYNKLIVIIEILSSKTRHCHILVSSIYFYLIIYFNDQFHVIKLSVFILCVWVFVWCQRPEENIRSTGVKSKGDCKSPCEHYELNPDSPQEQQVLFNHWGISLAPKPLNIHIQLTRSLLWLLVKSTCLLCIFFCISSVTRMRLLSWYT